jgi:ribonuclease P protein component
MFERATLSKSERLSREQLIASLFEAGQSFLSSSLIVYYKVNPLPESVPAQFLASVSKRKFPRAVDRNTVKRRLKEAYRLNKHPLYRHLVAKNLQLSVAFIYNDKKITSFNDIESKIKVALSELIKRL